MNAKVFAALLGAVALVLTGCPEELPAIDGGVVVVDSGPPLPDGGCLKDCSPGFKCDPVRRACVDGCDGACDGGSFCTSVPNQANTFVCSAPVIGGTCPNETCNPGQNLCVGGECSCSPASDIGPDSCFGTDRTGRGMFCTGLYNPASNTGGDCRAPRSYEACKRTDAGIEDGGNLVTCTGGDCAQCSDPNTQCSGHEFRFTDHCLRRCTFAANQGEVFNDIYINSDCDVNEVCYEPPADGGTGTCINPGLFGLSCDGPQIRADGGQNLSEAFNDAGTVPVGSRCISLPDRSRSGPPYTGTCSSLQFTQSTGNFRIDFCRAAGKVALGGACKREFKQNFEFTQCDVGLECVPTNLNGIDGACFKACNATASTPVYTAYPQCNAGETCTNFLRYDDNVGTVGACMQNCEIFDAGSGNYGCNPLLADGGVPTTCVPGSSGRALLNPSGAGFCAPRRAAGGILDAGTLCPERDPLRGVNCGVGTVCDFSASNQSVPQCIAVCDVTCTNPDGGTPPARCATQANALCGEGFTCRTSSTRAGTRLGLCQAL